MNLLIIINKKEFTNAFYNIPKQQTHLNTLIHKQKRMKKEVQKN